MPGFDRTGPMGEAPMTGGRRGLCAPSNTGVMPGYGRGLGLGRGFRGGRGPGRGFGRAAGFYPPVYGAAGQDESSLLRSQAESLQQSLDAINRRLDEIENASG
ncbi:MAG: DUF5320 domain-containing protein [Thermodesulfobacteriota bacterium]|nr:DUF5320 domain-containing protein [Thermodesulfobacteriota bacterium]